MDVGGVEGFILEEFLKYVMVLSFNELELVWLIVMLINFLEKIFLVVVKV